jgi:hypothetical protein
MLLSIFNYTYEKIGVQYMFQILKHVLHKNLEKDSSCNRYRIDYALSYNWGTKIDRNFLFYLHLLNFLLLIQY